MRTRFTLIYLPLVPPLPHRPPLQQRAPLRTLRASTETFTITRIRRKLEVSAVTSSSPFRWIQTRVCQVSTTKWQRPPPICRCQVLPIRPRGLGLPPFLISTMLKRPPRGTTMKWPSVRSRAPSHRRGIGSRGIKNSLVVYGQS